MSAERDKNRCTHAAPPQNGFPLEAAFADAAGAAAFADACGSGASAKGLPAAAGVAGLAATGAA